MDEHPKVLERRTTLADYVECESCSPQPYPGCRVAIDWRTPPGEFEISMYVECDALSLPRLLIDVMLPDGTERRRLVDTGGNSDGVKTKAQLVPPFVVEGLWCAEPRMKRRRDEPAPTEPGQFGERCTAPGVRQTLMSREATLVVRCISPQPCPTRDVDSAP